MLPEEEFIEKEKGELKTENDSESWGKIRQC